MNRHSDALPLDRIALEAAREAGDIDPALLGDFVGQVAAAVAGGTRLGRRELARYGDAGRRAAGEGVALRALVDLYLSAAWRMWRHLPEVINAAADPAAVVRAGEVMLRAADDAVAVLTEGYQLARRDLVRRAGRRAAGVRRRSAARWRPGAGRAGRTGRPVRPEPGRPACRRRGQGGAAVHRLVPADPRCWSGRSWARRQTPTRW